MALLTARILSEDDLFRTLITQLLRQAATPVTVSGDRAAQEGFHPDIVIVDGRNRQAEALSAIERVRAAAPNTSIFMVALESTPDLILGSMRAGANEFLMWPPAEGSLNEALARAAARRSSLPSARVHANSIAFIGAKGGAGTTTIAVNCAVEIARLSGKPTVIVDLKAGLGEVSLFLGVRSRYSVLDAIDNLHRLDSEFLKEVIVKHKSGLEILAGSDHFDRPGAADTPAVEEVLRLLARQYEHIVIDAGSQLTPCTIASLYTADTIYVVPNPDVPSVRNAQRLLDRIGQLGACGERTRIVLNRASEPYPIPPDQIESALGKPIDHCFKSDYRTVSAALNSGVPLSLTGNSELASQFDSFTRKTLKVSEPDEAQRRSTFGIQRIASMW
jgi:pilus assembly protein CpaE